MNSARFINRSACVRGAARRSVMEIMAREISELSQEVREINHRLGKFVSFARKCVRLTVGWARKVRELRHEVRESADDALKGRLQGNFSS